MGGFTTQEEVFEYILSCRLFDPEIFSHNFIEIGQNRDNQVRLRTRPGYKRFLEFVQQRFFPSVAPCWQGTDGASTNNSFTATSTSTIMGSEQLQVEQDVAQPHQQQQQLLGVQVAGKEQKKLEAQTGEQENAYNLPTSLHKFFRTNFGHFFEALKFFDKMAEYDAIVGSSRSRQQAKTKFNGKLVIGILKRAENGFKHEHLVPGNNPSKVAGKKLGEFIWKFKEHILCKSQKQLAAAPQSAFENWVLESTEEKIQAEILNFYSLMGRDEV